MNGKILRCFAKETTNQSVKIVKFWQEIECICVVVGSETYIMFNANKPGWDTGLSATVFQLVS